MIERVKEIHRKRRKKRECMCVRKKERKKERKRERETERERHMPRGIDLEVIT